VLILCSHSAPTASLDQSILSVKVETLLTSPEVGTGGSTVRRKAREPGFGGQDIRTYDHQAAAVSVLHSYPLQG
jgi:hypothetical protein